jgi:flagellar basal-body rod protein FlgB
MSILVEAKAVKQDAGISLRRCTAQGVRPGSGRTMGGVRGFLRMESILSRAMDAAVLRQQVAADNIANVNTPGFRRRFVRFEEALARALRGRGVAGMRTHPKHFPIGAASVRDLQPQVVLDATSAMRNDGNNVDIEREMAINAAAELQYAALTQVASARYRMLRSAISQGGR